MHLKQNNFYGQYNNNVVECYVNLEWYVLNTVFSFISNSIWAYTQYSDYSHRFNKVEVGYVLSK